MQEQHRKLSRTIHIEHHRTPYTMSPILVVMNGSTLHNMGRPYEIGMCAVHVMTGYHFAYDGISFRVLPKRMRVNQTYTRFTQTHISVNVCNTKPKTKSRRRQRARFYYSYATATAAAARLLVESRPPPTTQHGDARNATTHRRAAQATRVQDEHAENVGQRMRRRHPYTHSYKHKLHRRDRRYKRALDAKLAPWVLARG